jgi:putative membrane protein
MGEFLVDLRQWILALHVISVIAWMAGMLYLPRLYVYHCGVEVGSPESELFKVMERRLIRAIINPAMVAAVVFGVLLLLTPGVVDWGSGWIWVKLVAAVAMTGLHGAYSRWRRDFAEDRNTRPAKFYRYWNEVPTVLMILIVIMVIVRPF